MIDPFVESTVAVPCAGAVVMVTELTFRVWPDEAVSLASTLTWIDLLMATTAVSFWAIGFGSSLIGAYAAALLVCSADPKGPYDKITYVDSCVALETCEMRDSVDAKAHHVPRNFYHPR